MNLDLPFLELSVLIPLFGAVWVSRFKDPDRAQRHCQVFGALTLLCALGAWQDFILVSGDHLPAEVNDPWDVLIRFGHGKHLLTIDALSAPLLPLIALLYLLTTLSTHRTKIRRFSFAWTLVSEGIILAAFSCKEPWGIIVLLGLGTVPPLLELRARDKPMRVVGLHMALYVGCMMFGQFFAELHGTRGGENYLAVVLLLGAVLIRSGIAPFHCWVTDLFEHATFGAALLFVIPISGAYVAVRLLVPIAPDWVLRSIGMLSIITAVYAAGMALVQKEARRFFVYIFLSHSALVLVGLDSVNPLGLTGALCVWLSVGVALGGFGLTLRALEARHGRLSLTRFHGVYDNTPALAVCFLLTGLASVGFPGTWGFLGTEMLIDGAVETYPGVGVAVILAAALNGIAVVKVYFALFTGTRHSSTVPLKIRWHERFAVLLLAALIFGGGLMPQPGVASRHRAAVQILAERLAPARQTHAANEPEPVDNVD